MKILRIIAENLYNYDEGIMDISLVASDRVLKQSDLFQLQGSIYSQNIVALVGINASGKTRTLSILEYILNILLEKRDLNGFLPIPYGIGDGTTFRVYFIDNNKVYEWTAILAATKKSQGINLVYKEELLKEKTLASVKTRAALFNFAGDAVGQKRSELDPSILEMMKNDSSITVKFNKDRPQHVISFVRESNYNVLSPTGTIPPEVINVFDTSIEYIDCSVNEGGAFCKLKFREEEQAYEIRNFAQINEILSSGTVKGNEVFIRAIAALSCGGYLIIDEVENHFHKELVKLLLDLFKNKSTNPHGATIIFSTHYIEILDIVDRKDNIYLTIKNKNKICVKKYSEYVKRNDLKKSEILISGIVKGTAPKYENIKRFKELVYQWMQKS